MEQNSIITLVGFIISAISAIIVALIGAKIKINIFKILTAVLIIITIVLLFVFVYLQLSPKPPTEITIISPNDNDEVEKTITVKGIYKNIYNEKIIWIFVNPLKVNRYYPQNNYAELEANNKWSSLVYIGQDNDVGQKFNICAVLVDNNAQMVIDDYLKNSKNKQNSPGLETLPKGAIKYHTITVNRK